MNTKFIEELAALPEEVRWKLQRIDGFLDLRLVERARQELQGIPAPLRTTTPLVDISLRLAFEEKNWTEAVRLASEISRRMPDEAESYVQLAFATRRADGLEPAQFILEEALRRFPDVAVISFNLACYACQGGRNDQAMDHLKRAFQLDARFRASALEDDDLKPLWPLLD